MHLGVNAVFLQPRMGGLETYVRRLLPALLEARPGLRLSVFAGERGLAAMSDEAWFGEVSPVRHRLLGRPGTRALTELTLLGRLATRSGVDVLHSVALVAPLAMRPASVLTVADVIWNREPDPAEIATVRLWRAVVPLCARRADRVITLSEAAGREIVEDLRVAPERIDVIPCGPGVETSVAPTPDAELRRKLGLGDGEIVLSVSALKAHKNLERLVEAMAVVRQRRPEAVLVVPANPTPLQRELEDRARELGIAEAVCFPGWVSPADLEGLYRAASCFAFPSRREGFGLPVLEAMRRGVPVACSSASAIPEVAGKAALYFDPRRPDEIADRLLRLLEDKPLAARLVAQGVERQRLFTWRRTAERTLESYERALVARARR